MNDFVYCNNCGQALPRGSRFCNVCGANVLGAPAGPRPDAIAGQAPAWPQTAARREMVEDEKVIFTIRPTMIFVYAWYALAALIVISVSALMGILSSKAIVSGEVALIVILAVALVAFSVPFYKHVLRRREVYTLTNFKLEMRYGLIAKNVRNIPLNKIQDVTVTSSVWQRLLGLGDIVIDSASETGKIHLDDIKNADRYADIILGELRRRN
jgi:membrane protein YdbS with pleckstrin-like domain